VKGGHATGPSSEMTTDDLIHDTQIIELKSPPYFPASVLYRFRVNSIIAWAVTLCGLLRIH